MKINVLLAALVSAGLIFLLSAYAEDNSPLESEKTQTVGQETLSEEKEKDISSERPGPQEPLAPSIPGKDRPIGQGARSGRNEASSGITEEQTNQIPIPPGKEQEGGLEQVRPGEKEKSEETTEGQGKGTPDVKKQENGQNSGVKDERLPDRRWILKFQDQKGKLPEKKPPTVKWESDEQEQRCQSYLSRLKELFRQTRYYSVHGDACNTARFAKQFMDQTEVCEKECPPDFLKNKGYSEQVVRNVGVLLELAQKRCMQPVQ